MLGAHGGTLRMVTVPRTPPNCWSGLTPANDREVHHRANFPSRRPRRDPGGLTILLAQRRAVSSLEPGDRPARRVRQLKTRVGMALRPQSRRGRPSRALAVDEHTVRGIGIDHSLGALPRL